MTAAKKFFRSSNKSSIFQEGHGVRSSVINKGSLASKALAVAAGFLLTASFVGKAAADPIPGTVIVGYFDTAESTSDNGTGDGDNIVRIVNDTGKEMCALIYVFDDDEEM